MLDLPHHETELRGEWTLSEGRVIADHTCRRIEALTRLVLKRVAAHPSDGGWTILFRDPRDGRLWERTYPKSELHGGGPPLLRQISLAEAMEAYGTASLEGHVDVTSDVALAPWKKKSRTSLPMCGSIKRKWVAGRSP
ncbi:Imm27 family immunity protein [Bosea sp. LjRoot90]|uniref:Imm27 family immunity protein n=1 Tax=Bosea sp. LjRoot90 TaxID=3342342 RepID=UPI003F50225F